MVAQSRDVVQACNLIDIGYKVYLFMWSNKRYRPCHIEERLDRFFLLKNGAITSRITTIKLVNWVSTHFLTIIEVKERCNKMNYKDFSFEITTKTCRVHMRHGEMKDEWVNYGGRVWENQVQQFQKVTKIFLALLKNWSKNELKDR